MLLPCVFFFGRCMLLGDACLQPAYRMLGELWLSSFHIVIVLMSHVLLQVEWVGQPIGLVVAESRAIAEHGAALVKV